MDRRLAELDEKQLAATSKSSTLGYHSQIMPDADNKKWVQIDLGRSQPIDDLVLYPAHVKYGGHPGPGFGFPPRFIVEISDDPEFATKQVVADHTSDNVPNPGDTPYVVQAFGTPGRYIRITATRLWKRTDDWIFALSELAVLSGGKNLATGATVTALDSIEAGVWAKKNLVDGFTSQVAVDLAVDRQRSASKASCAERDKLLEEKLDATLRAERRSVAERQAELRREVAALPPLAMVYAAANQRTAANKVVPPPTPRPIYLLARGDVRNPGKLVEPGALSCVSSLSGSFALADSNDEASRRRPWPNGSSILRIRSLDARSSIESGKIILAAGSSIRPTISAGWDRCRLIRNCWTGWPVNS